MTSKKMPKAFTLIELLIVVAIIGILAAVVIVNLDKAQAKSRDARRIADLHTMKSAALIYHDATGLYPLNPCNNAYCYIPSTDADVGSESCKTTACTGETQDTCTNSGNCNTNIFSELLDGNYIDKLPADPLNNKQSDETRRKYYYYHDIGGHRAIISLLEVVQADTVNDAYLLPNGGQWGCKMQAGTDKNLWNSYCVALD